MTLTINFRIDCAVDTLVEVVVFSIIKLVFGRIVSAVDVLNTAVGVVVVVEKMDPTEASENQNQQLVT